MKTFRAAIVILSTLLITGCVSTSYYADYKIYLSQVELPLNAVKQYSGTKIDNNLKDPRYKFCFEDSLVKISWFTDSRQILFLVENKTDQTIKIPWDEAAYVDINGFSHRVIHSGINFDDKERPQPPSIIVRKGLLDDSIIPSDYVKWIDSGGEHSVSHWDEESFLMDFIDSKNSKEDIYTNFLNEVKPNIGKCFEVLLPLQIQNITHEYLFTFSIYDIKVKKR